MLEMLARETKAAPLRGGRLLLTKTKLSAVVALKSSDAGTVRGGAAAECVKVAASVGAGDDRAIGPLLVSHAEDLTDASSSSSLED